MKKVRAKKDELMGMQNNQFNRQKEIDTTKGLILQKKIMLEKLTGQQSEQQQRF